MNEQVQPQTIDQKQSDKELNFRQLEAKYQRQLDQERSARIEAERIAQEATQKKQIVQDDDDNDDEPYVDKKKLEKKLARFGEQTKQQTKSEIQVAVQQAIQEERKQNWMNQILIFTMFFNMQRNLLKEIPILQNLFLICQIHLKGKSLFIKTLRLLVYINQKQNNHLFRKIDANKRSPYYQPTGTGTAPYASQGDFSPQGQKQAYEKMKELKSKYGM